MKSYKDAEYRLRLAQGFLNEAQQDVELKRWRSTMDDAQLAVENAAKTALALMGPVGRTHNPAVQLRHALRENLFPEVHQGTVQRLAELAEIMGPDVHIRTDYGDEIEGRTPWELFDEADAHQALEMAKEAVNLAQRMVEDVKGDER